MSLSVRLFNACRLFLGPCASYRVARALGRRAPAPAPAACNEVPVPAAALAQVRQAAEDAASDDFAFGTTTPNPYPHDRQRRVTWAASYHQRYMTLQEEWPGHCVRNLHGGTA